SPRPALPSTAARGPHGTAAWFSSHDARGARDSTADPRRAPLLHKVKLTLCEDLLPPARLPTPLPAWGGHLVRPGGDRDGCRSRDPVPRRPDHRPDPARPDRPLAARRRDRGCGPAPPGVQRLAAPDRRPRIARRGVRPPQPNVRAPPVARGRVLRRAADRSTHVASHGRPPGRALLPRVRAD